MAALDWLSNWDDLVHGTAVFSAAIPFAIGSLSAWKLPASHWWLGVALAIIGPYLWLFGLPAVPPVSSEDVPVLAVVLSVIVLALSPKVKLLATVALIVVLFGWLQWCVYPAWLSDEGGVGRKLLVCSGVVGAMVLAAACAEVAVNRPDCGKLGKCHLSLSAFVPPMIALAILLQLGGAARLGQAAGAFAAALGAVCLFAFVKKQRDTTVLTPALWGLFFALLGCSGWLFAEVRYGLAVALCLAPIAGLMIRFLPLLPRKSVRHDLLWDGLASAIVSVAVAGIAVSDYLAEASEFEGY